jgi:hypothetical protein
MAITTMLTGAHGKGLISQISGTGRCASLEAHAGACMRQVRCPATERRSFQPGTNRSR